MSNCWRLIKSGFGDAYTNMATDEAIFLNFCEKNTAPVLRLYGWQSAAFSLGCSQKPDQLLDLSKCRRANIPFVRRISAGGAIFHDQELTYSLCCAQEDIKAFGSVGESFSIICSFLMNAYRLMNLNPVFARQVKTFVRLDEPSDFCYGGCAKYDILINGKKIGGNAQRRKRNFIFQHGSIPIFFRANRALEFLKEKPENLEARICSLSQALGKEIGFYALQDILIKSFKEVFSVELKPDCLTRQEQDLASFLKENKYSQDDWNLKRNEKGVLEAALAG
jgi:lipoate-protein ligase A